MKPENVFLFVVIFIAVIVGLGFFSESKYRQGPANQQQSAVSFKTSDLKPTQVNDAGKIVPLKGSEKPLNPVKPGTVYNMEPATVNLPAGETFLYIIAGEQALRIGLDSHGSDVYVTTSRRFNRYDPRKVTFWGPGSMPHTWKPLLYIQER
jgi:hypothetical protein